MRVSLQFIAILLLGAQAVPAGNAIQFSASAEEFVGEGIVYHRLHFQDGDRGISYRPPNGWKCALIDNRLRLMPNDKNFAEAQIDSAPLDQPVVFDAAIAASVAQQSLAALPVGNQEAAMVKQDQNTLPLNNNPTLETIISYKLMGETFQRGVIVAITPNNQITFKFSARKADFDALYRAFRASISTWEWQPAVAKAATAP
jgi:hypothetical protein